MTAQFWEVAEAALPAVRHWDAMDGPDPGEYR